MLVATPQEIAHMTMTHASMEPLRAEHRELLPSIEAIAAVAADAWAADPSALLPELNSTLEFLQEHLLIHAQAEDDVLYPAVERAMHAPGATDTMRRDHVEVAHLIGELADLRRQVDGGLTAELRQHLVRTLYALHGIVTLHFAKEEEIYVPLLEGALSPAEAETMLEEMERAADRHRAAGH